jgi:hypothetical protein
MVYFSLMPPPQTTVISTRALLGSWRHLPAG